MIDLTFAFVYIMFAHYVSDFILQTNWQAKNKSKNVAALSSHVATYGLGMLVLLGTPVLLGAHDAVMLYFIAVYVAFNTAVHFVIDLVSSQFTAHYHRVGKTHAFFCVIGLDQFLHQAILLLSVFPIIGFLINGSFA